jgi:hypothetical protein
MNNFHIRRGWSWAMQPVIRIAWLFAAFCFLAIATSAISAAVGPATCCLDDAFGRLDPECAKYRLAGSSYYATFDVVEVNRILDISQNRRTIMRVDFTVRLKSDPGLGDFHESAAFNKEHVSWRLMDD